MELVSDNSRGIKTGKLVERLNRRGILNPECGKCYWDATRRLGRAAGGAKVNPGIRGHTGVKGSL